MSGETAEPGEVEFESKDVVVMSLTPEDDVVRVEVLFHKEDFPPLVLKAIERGEGPFYIKGTLSWGELVSEETQLLELQAEVVVRSAELDQAMTDSLAETLQAIRGLISRHPLNPQLRADRDSWDRLCRGLNGISDADSASGKLAALNVVRAELAMVPLEEDSVEAGAEAVRAELEEQERVLKAYHGGPLSPLFDKDPWYDLGNAYSAARACLPGESREQLEYNQAGTKFLLQKFKNVDEELRRRGYDEGSPVCLEIADAIYILERSWALINGASDADPRDICLLVEHGLPPLLQSVLDFVTSLDNGEPDDV